MSEFLKVYQEYYELGLSANAIHLLSFIATRTAVSDFSMNGEKYIYLLGANDPRKFFESWSKNTYRRALDELKNSGIIRYEYIKGSKNKKVAFLQSTQISDILKNGTHKYPKVRHYNTQISDISFNNKRLSKRITEKINTNISDLSNTNSIDGKAEVIQKSIPSYDDLLKYSSENNLNFSIQDFIDYYSEKNWLINGKPIKSWKALANSWANKQFVRDSRLFGENSYSFYLSLSPELQKQVDADQASNTRGWIRYETQKAIDEFMAKKITPFIIVQTVNDDISEV